jgi:hypothetical protein
LHARNYRGYGLRGLTPIGFTKFDAFDGPVCIETRFRPYGFDNDIDESGATGIGFLDGVRDRGLQLSTRNRLSIVSRSYGPKQRHNMLQQLVDTIRISAFDLIFTS